MEDASILADADGMNAYDALIFNTRRENLPDFGDWEMEAGEKEGTEELHQGRQGFRLHTHRVLRAVRVGGIRRSHRWRLGYRHQLSPTLRAR